MMLGTTYAKKSTVMTQESPDMAPQTAAENLERRTVSLPPQMWQEIEEVGDEMGLKKAEIYRFIMAEGLLAQKAKQAASLDYENKLLLRQKLQQRQQRTFAALVQLESATTEDERAEALAQLKQCLTD